MSRKKCGGCKQYFESSELYFKSSLQNFCSQECLFAHNVQKPIRRQSNTLKQNQQSDIPMETRAVVLARDFSRCRFCGCKDGHNLHHIEYRSENGSHDESNLITLCPQHHALVHSDKGRFQPLCKGIVFFTYLGYYLTIPRFEKWIISLDE